MYRGKNFDPRLIVILMNSYRKKKLGNYELYIEESIVRYLFLFFFIKKIVGK